MSSKHPVKECSQCIQICVRSLCRILTILLNGRISLLTDDLRTHIIEGRRVLCCTEVYQLDHTFFGNKDIVGRQVSVNHATLMYLSQCMKNRKYNSSTPLIILLATGFLKDLFDIHTLKVFHDAVTGSVLLKEARYLYHSSDIMKSGNTSCLL